MNAEHNSCGKSHPRIMDSWGILDRTRTSRVKVCCDYHYTIPQNKTEAAPPGGLLRSVSFWLSPTVNALIIWSASKRRSKSFLCKRRLSLYLQLSCVHTLRPFYLPDSRKQANLCFWWTSVANVFA